MHEKDEYSALARPLLSSSYSQQNQQQEQLMKQQRPIEKGIAKEEKPKYNKNLINRKNNYKPIIYTVVGIIGAIALAGFIISGGLLLNVNKGVVSLSPSSNIPLVQGAIYGHVSGPAGLPAIGATVVAAKQQTGHIVNSIISIDGNYYFQLPAGRYNVMVAFPDGNHKTVNNFEVQSGAAENIDFVY
ncbi:MAG: carboxypeptidase regulatory-like domain-containing protein [Nitrososphaeraceae archaeon]|nr:carboxypeptidase regulatory-like domain-containing protein [Nitrososphaeraceae archaeon]